LACKCFDAARNCFTPSAAFSTSDLHRDTKGVGGKGGGGGGRRMLNKLVTGVGV
jgi:hypothetical protein